MATAVENGFEVQVPGVQGRTFFPWHLSDTGKDLILIDRISNMTPADFFYAAEDDHERERGPVMLGLMATSIRAKFPDWSVERIIRTVLDLSLEEVVWVGGDEDKPAGPPEAPGGDGDTPEPSEMQNESADTTSEISSETSPSSTAPGSESTTT